MNRVPVEKEDSIGERLARQPEGIRVVPFLRPLVDDEAQAKAEAALEIGDPFLHPMGGESGDDDHLVEADGAQVPEGEVENGPTVVERQQSLGEACGQGMKPASRSCSEDESDH
jgi:hypothetical protein